jgi:hypothetical protein
LYKKPPAKAVFLLPDAVAQYNAGFLPLRLHVYAMRYAIEQRFDNKDSKPVSSIRRPARKSVNASDEVNTPRASRCRIARVIG